MQNEVSVHNGDIIQYKDKVYTVFRLVETADPRYCLMDENGHLIEITHGELWDDRIASMSKPDIWVELNRH